MIENMRIDQLECPYCEHLNPIEYHHFEHMGNSNECEGTAECDRCDKEFEYGISVDFTYYGSTWKSEETQQ